MIIVCCKGAQKSKTAIFHVKSHFAWRKSATNRVPMHPWKYLNFFLINSRPWKYLKTGQVLESPWISFHRSLKVLEFMKSNYAMSATSLNSICIGLECIFFRVTRLGGSFSFWFCETYRLTYFMLSSCFLSTRSFNLPDILPNTRFANNCHVLFLSTKTVP